MITGIGLTAPNGDNLADFRKALLEKRSGVVPYEIRYVGKTFAGLCNFDANKYQKKKEVRRGTRKRILIFSVFVKPEQFGEVRSHFGSS